MTQTSGEVKTTNLITPEGIFSYPWVAEAQPLDDDAEPGQKEKFGIVVAFEKGADLTALKAATIAVADAKFGKGKYTFGAVEEGSPVKQIRSPFRKYDVADKPGYPEGGTYINARTTKKPQVVYRQAGPDGKPLQIPADKIREEIYAGSRGRISVNVFAYDKKGNRGVSFALNNIQKMGEGDRIDGRLNAKDEFTADLTQTPADLDGLV